MLENALRSDDAHPETPTASRSRSALLLILTLACIGAAAAYKLRLESWRIDGQLNTAMFEAGAWLRGTFEITDHPYELAHVSGHAYVADIISFVNSVNARTVVPIHTFEPKMYREHFPNVTLLRDGMSFDVV